jgi:hypothetical protein
MNTTVAPPTFGFPVGWRVLGRVCPFVNVRLALLKSGAMPSSSSVTPFHKMAARGELLAAAELT